MRHRAMRLASLTTALLLLSVAGWPRSSRAQASTASISNATLDVFLEQSAAQNWSTWTEASPAHFSWWDLDASQPSVVSCSYNPYIPIPPGADVFGSINVLLCQASTNGGSFRAMWSPPSPYFEYATPNWFADRAGTAPLWPNKLSYQLGPSNVGAVASFSTTGPVLKFHTVNVFLTKDQAGESIVNYQFADPTVISPEPESAVLLAAGLLVLLFHRVSRGNETGKTNTDTARLS